MILVSIIGDSISTYEGYNPQGYAVFYDKVNQAANGLVCVYDTWWAKVNQAFGAHLCINNSYSGSKVSGGKFPAASSEERIGNLSNAGLPPDVILIYIGFNDFGYGIPIGKDGIQQTRTGECTSFSDAYLQMIRGIRRIYPESAVVCGTLMRTKILGKDSWIFPEAYCGIEFEEYNETIRRVCRETNCILADLSALNIRYETLDGTHPTSAGHKEIARAWIECLKQSGVFHPSAESCIRHYHENENDDQAVYMAFSSLYHERLLLPFSNNGKLSGLFINGREFIPIFTNYHRIGKNEPITLKPILLSAYIDLLQQAGRPLLINPFSEPELQFIIPHAAIELLLKRANNR